MIDILKLVPPKYCNLIPNFILKHTYFDFEIVNDASF